MIRKPGKVITTIEYRKNGHRVLMELRLVKASQVSDTDHFNDTLMYLVDHDDPRVRVVGTDAETVRQETFKKLDELLNITWKRMIVIEFSSDSCQSGRQRAEQSRELDFSYAYHDFGITSGGKKVSHELRLIDNVLEPRRGNPEQGWPTEDHDGDVWEGVAAIDYTPENDAKIKAVCAAFDALGENLKLLLDQKHILKTLSNVKTLGLPFAGGKKP